MQHSLPSLPVETYNMRFKRFKRLKAIINLSAMELIT